MYQTKLFFLIPKRFLQKDVFKTPNQNRPFKHFVEHLVMESKEKKCYSITIIINTFPLHYILT